MTRAAIRIDGQDEAESALGPFSLSSYGSWWVRDVYDVRELQLSTSEDEREATVLELEMIRTPPTHRVRCRFPGVAQLSASQHEVRKGDLGFQMRPTGF